MEKVSLWCKLIALISILSSVILLILPESKSKKAFKTLLSVVMIYAFISPFSDAEIDFTKLHRILSNSYETDTQETIQDYSYYPLITAVEAETENYFNNLLSDLSIAGECKAVCEMESGNALLKEIIFFCEISESEKEIIKIEAEKVCGKDIIISFSGE